MCNTGLQVIKVRSHAGPREGNKILEDWDWSEEGSVPHPFLAGGSASVTTSSLDHGYLNPAPPQIDSAPKPMSPL